LLQRSIAAAAVGFSVFTRFHAMPPHAAVAVLLVSLLLIDDCAALLLLIGLWTPIAGALIACCEFGILISGGEDFWLHLVLVTLGATLAMIGPGARSIDAILFGRKQIKLPLGR
jgi:uncharacterized membrane protein YphA (DoxX/SURF4 family)